MKLLSFIEATDVFDHPILKVCAHIGSETLHIGSIGEQHLIIHRPVPPHILKELLTLTIPDTNFMIDDVALAAYREQL